jgi:hypothetical protein
MIPVSVSGSLSMAGRQRVSAGRPKLYGLSCRGTLPARAAAVVATRIRAPSPATGAEALPLAVADGADRGPAPRPSRPAIIRREACEGVADTIRAGSLTLRAYRSDPEDIWALAELAEFRASHGAVAAPRQRAPASYESPPGVASPSMRPCLL